MIDWRRLVLHRLDTQAPLTGPLNQEAVDELAAHLEMVYQAGLGRGLSQRDAMAVAQAELDGLRPASLTHPPSRRWTPGMRLSFLQDVRAAWRTLTARPAFALGVTLMLAIGLGFNIAIYAVVESAILRPLPYDTPDRVAFVWRGFWPDGTGRVNSFPEFEDVKTRSRSFSSVAAYNISFAPLYEGEAAEQINGAVVTSEFFAVLGRRAALGRTLEAGDEIPTDDRPIVLSHALWTRRFGQDPNLVNRTINVGGRTRRVVGIMPADFEQPEPFWGETTEYWTPMSITDSMRASRGNRYLRVIGRLAPGVSLDAAQAELETVRLARRAETGDTSDGDAVVVRSVFSELVGPTQVWLLACTVGASLVLLLAMGNIVNLMLANTAARTRELAIRTALGANRLHLARQMISESLCLAMAGGLMGVGFGWLILKNVLASGGDLARLDQTSIDGSVWAVAAALSVVTGVVCGAWPAWRVTRGDVARNLISGTRGTTGMEVSRARTWLIAGEMALAVPLVTGAVLLAITLVQLLRVDTGFDASHAVHFRITLPSNTGQRYATPEARIALIADLEQRLLAIPGVSAAGVVSTLPLGGLNNTGGAFTYERLDGSTSTLVAGFRSASADYFNALGINVTQGRVFGNVPEDDQSLVINQRFAATFWPGADPIGRRVRMGDTSPWRTIVGVVKDVRHQQLNMPAEAEAFWPYRTDPWSTISVVVRADNPDAVLPRIGPTVADLDRSIPVVSLSAVSDVVADTREPARLSAAAAVLFGALATALSAFGTFAVLSLLVGARTREIGIRLALGATRAGVRRLVLRDALTPAFIGGAAGTAAALWIARTLSAYVYGVDPRSPWIFAAATGALLGVVVLAAWWPARRAVQVDPAITLRADL